MITPEQKIKKEIKAFIDKSGGFWSIVQGGPYSKVGDPDIVCFFPHDGRFIGIEAKTPRGVQSEVQKIRQREIEDKGGIYLLVHSLDELKRMLAELGISDTTGISTYVGSARSYMNACGRIIDRLATDKTE